MANIVDIIFRGRDEVTKTLTGIKAGVTGLTSSLGPLSGVLGAVGLTFGGLAAGAVISRIKSAVGAFDDMADSAKRVGVGVEAYQEMSFAAAQAGVPMETLNKALVVTAKGLDEASRGTGSLLVLVNKLKAEGQNVQLFENGQARESAEVFTDIVDALGGVEDASRRTALGVDFLSARGVKLLQLGDQFRALREQARSIGAVISAEDVARFAESSDKLDALSSVLTLRLNAALAEAAPIVLRLTEGILGLTTATIDYFDTSKRGEGGELVTGLWHTLAAGIRDARFELDLLTRAQKDAADAGPSEFQRAAIAAVASELRAAAAAADEVREADPFAWGRAIDATVARSLRSVADEIENLHTAVDSFMETEDDLPRWASTILSAFDSVPTMLAEVKQRLIEAGREARAPRGDPLAVLPSTRDAAERGAAAGAAYMQGFIGPLQQPIVGPPAPPVQQGAALDISPEEMTKLAIEARKYAEQAQLAAAATDALKASLSIAFNFRSSVDSLLGGVKELGAGLRTELAQAALRGPGALRAALDDAKIAGTDLGIALTKAADAAGAQFGELARKQSAATRQMLVDIDALQRASAERTLDLRASLSLDSAPFRLELEQAVREAERRLAEFKQSVVEREKAGGARTTAPLGAEPVTAEGQAAVLQATDEFNAIKLAKERAHQKEMEALRREVLLGALSEEQAANQERLFALDDFYTRMQQAVAEGAASVAEAQAAVNERTRQTAEANNPWASVFDVDAQQAGQDAIKNFGDSFSQLMVDLGTGAKDGGDAIQEFLIGALNTLSQTALEIGTKKLLDFAVTAATQVEIVPKQIAQPEPFIGPLPEGVVDPRFDQAAATMLTSSETYSKATDSFGGFVGGLADSFLNLIGLGGAGGGGAGGIGSILGGAGVIDESGALGGQGGSATVIAGAADVMATTAATEQETTSGFGGFVTELASGLLSFLGVEQTTQVTQQTTEATKQVTEQTTTSLFSAAVTQFQAAVAQFAGGGGAAPAAGALPPAGGGSTQQPGQQTQQGQQGPSQQTALQNSLVTTIGTATIDTFNSLVSPLGFVGYVDRFDSKITPVGFIAAMLKSEIRQATIGASVILASDFNNVKQNGAIVFSQDVKEVKLQLVLSSSSSGGGGATAQHGAITTRTGLVLVHPKEAIIPIEMLRGYIRDEQTDVMANLRPATMQSSVMQVEFGVPPALPPMQALVMFDDMPEIPNAVLQFGEMPPPPALAFGPLPELPELRIGFGRLPSLGFLGVMPAAPAGGGYIPRDDYRRMASLATGGITTQSGIVQVHPGEAVIPTDALRRMIRDESGGGNTIVSPTLIIGDAGQGRKGDKSEGDRAEALMAGMTAAIDAYVRGEQRPGGILEGTGPRTVRRGG